MKEPSAIQPTAAFFGLPKHVVDVLGEPTIQKGVELYLKAQSEIATLKEKLAEPEKYRELYKRKQMQVFRFIERLKAAEKERDELQRLLDAVYNAQNG